ncbi:DUF4232 domain-containing protein [Streptomyces sp. NPDC029003]|uniref:DUF4232 domain-containing protein n=1 Tax=Streptomyces sp. NPDC029003 TaxID=3155125 RepID=UPI0033F0267F
MKATRSSLALLAAGLLTASLSAGIAEAAVSTPRAPAPACTSSRLVPGGAQRVGAAQVRVTVMNKGPGPCVLKSFPTVAIAGSGSPGSGKALTVVRQGKARAVQLAPGGRATTQLTFTPVLGEADGYCASGGHPVVAPSIVVGVAGSGGGLQLAPDDGGEFALCGGSVRATAFH